MEPPGNHLQGLKRFALFRNDQETTLYRIEEGEISLILKDGNIKGNHDQNSIVGGVRKERKDLASNRTVRECLLGLKRFSLFRNDQDPPPRIEKRELLIL